MLNSFLIVALLGVIYSCGKKENSPPQEETPRLPSQSEREEFLEKQLIVCESGTFCPDYLVKIVVYDKGSYRYCTGTLVGRNRLVTSSSCLPIYLRTTDASCKEDIHFFLNRGNRKPERVACKSILQVSSLEGNSPEYWRDDVAVLELAESLYWRETRDVSRRGLKDNEKIRFYGVEAVDSVTGVIRKEECEVVHGSYLYPLSANESSPNLLLTGCKRKPGYRGASIIDNYPRIRAIVSDNSSFRSSLENSSLLIKPLQDFIHAMNFACAPFLNETSRLNEAECAKLLDYSSVAGERQRLLSDEERLGTILSKLIKAADAASKYFKIFPELVLKNDRLKVVFKPSCFKSVSSWINSVKKDTDVTEAPSFPSRTLRKGVDSYGRAVTQEFEEKPEKYYLTFSGKRLFKEKLSDVFHSTEETDTIRINGIKACP